MKKNFRSLISLTVLLFLAMGCGGGNDEEFLNVLAGYAKGGNNCGNNVKEAPHACEVGKDLRIFHPSEAVLDFNFLFSLGRIEEVSIDGNVINTYLVGSSNKGSYLPLETNDGISISKYSFISETASFVGEFSKKVYFGILKSSIVENVICSGCTTGVIGKCQNPRSGACAAESTPGFCPRRFLICNETVVIEKDFIGLSVKFGTLNFSSPENILRYTTQIKVKRNAGQGDGEQTLEDIDIESLIDLPIEATVRNSGGSDYIIPVQITFTRVTGDTVEIILEFPAVPVGDIINYN